MQNFPHLLAYKEQLMTASRLALNPATANETDRLLTLQGLLDAQKTNPDDAQKAAQEAVTIYRHVAALNEAASNRMRISQEGRARHLNLASKAYEVAFVIAQVFNVKSPAVVDIGLHVMWHRARLDDAHGAQEVAKHIESLSPDIPNGMHRLDWMKRHMRRAFPDAGL